MTKKWSNLNLPGALHYVTGTVLHRMPIFKQEKYCTAFLGAFADLLRDWPSKLIAFVVMPDHFHLIVNPRDGNVKGFAGALKSLSARKIVELDGGDHFLRAVDHDWWWPDDSEKLSKAMKELGWMSAGASHPS